MPAGPAPAAAEPGAPRDVRRRAFRLVVDKGSPDALVSFCGEGVRKIAPTQFEMRKDNFTPTRDLDVLILARPKE